MFAPTVQRGTAYSCQALPELVAGAAAYLAPCDGRCPYRCRTAPEFS